MNFLRLASVWQNFGFGRVHEADDTALPIVHDPLILNVKHLVFSFHVSIALLYSLPDGEGDSKEHLAPES